MEGCRICRSSAQDFANSAGLVDPACVLDSATLCKALSVQSPGLQGTQP